MISGGSSKGKTHTVVRKIRIKLLYQGYKFIAIIKMSFNALNLSTGALWFSITSVVESYTYNASGCKIFGKIDSSIGMRLESMKKSDHCFRFFWKTVLPIGSQSVYLLLFCWVEDWEINEVLLWKYLSHSGNRRLDSCVCCCFFGYLYSFLKRQIYEFWVFL